MKSGLALLVAAALCLCGCSKKEAARPIAPILKLTPAQQALLGVPCRILEDAFCAHLTGLGKADLCKGLEPLRIEAEDDCRFALEDGQVQQELLTALQAGKPLSFSIGGKLPGRYGDTEPTQLNFDDGHCQGFDEWHACLKEGCRVHARCVTGTRAGRCDPTACDQVSGGSSVRNPRGGSCQMSGRKGRDLCALLWRPEAAPKMAPIKWTTMGGRRVGCGAHGAAACEPVADSSHPAGWRCEGERCSMWIEGFGGAVTGCLADGKDTPGRCVPFLKAEGSGIGCRDLDPPCASCELGFGQCVSTGKNP